jgi:hypothetical protein
VAVTASPSRPDLIFDKMAGMFNLLAVLASVFVATCIWLTVQLVNRRERWAKRALAGMVSAGALVGAYAFVYTRMVRPSIPDDFLGPGKVALVPEYDDIGRIDQSFCEKVFAPANWVDRRARPKIWFADLPSLTPCFRSPKSIEEPFSWRSKDSTDQPP